MAQDETYPPGSGVVWARVSSEEQAEGHSLEAQVDRGREYSVAHRIGIVQEFVVESAKTAGRKKFDAMVEFVRSRPDVVHIVVEKMDRWARNYSDMGIIEELVQKGKFIHFVRDGFCIHARSTTADYLRFGASGFFSTFFKQDQQEKIRKGMEKALSKGLWPHPAPYGYRTNHETKVKEPHPVNARWYVRIKELAAEGLSLSKIKEKLREEGFAQAAGPQWLSDIIRNPFGTGRFLKGGKWHEGAHKPLISWELHQTAVRSLERRSKKRLQKYDFPYSGLVRCGVCGRSIIFEKAKGRYVYGRCARRNLCGNERIRQADLEAMLAAPIEGIKMKDDAIQWIVAKLSDVDKTSAADRQRKVDGLRREISKLATMMDKAYEDQLSGELPVDMWREKRDRWQNDKLRLTSVLEGLTSEQTTSSNAVATTLVELGKSLTTAFFSATAHERAEILRFVCSNLTLTHGKLEFSYRKPFELFAKAASSEEWGTVTEEVRTSVESLSIEDVKPEIQKMLELVMPYLTNRTCSLATAAAAGEVS